MSTPDGLGKIAYDAYGDCRGWVVFNGDPMPRWDDQDEAIKRCWQAAAVAVADHVYRG